MQDHLSFYGKYGAMIAFFLVVLVLLAVVAIWKTSPAVTELPAVINGTVSAISDGGVRISVVPADQALRRAYPELEVVITDKTQLYRKILLGSGAGSIVPASDLVSIPFTELKTGNSVTVTPVRDSAGYSGESFDALLITIE